MLDAGCWTLDDELDREPWALQSERWTTLDPGRWGGWMLLPQEALLDMLVRWLAARLQNGRSHKSVSRGMLRCNIALRVAEAA